MLIDTGAAMSVVKKELFDRITPLNEQQLRQGPVSTARAANGSIVPLLGTVVAPMTLGGREFKHRVYNAQDLTHEVILGSDCLHKFKAVIDFDQSVFLLPGAEAVYLGRQINQTDSQPLSMVQTEHLTPRSQSIVSLNVTDDIPDGTLGIVKPNPTFCSKYMLSGRCLVTVCNGPKACATAEPHLPTAGHIHKRCRIRYSSIPSSKCV